MELTKSEVQKLSAKTQIKEMYYVPNLPPVSDALETHTATATDTPTSLQAALAKIRADRTRDEKGYTGEGIRIGQIEVNIPDTSKSYLSNASIEIFTDGVDRPANDHASVVAGIMISNKAGNLGIVPDAELYSAAYDSRSSLKIAVEWMIGSKKVHVINMSAGFLDVDSIYDDLSKWMDHIALNHSVHFIAAVGNYHLYNPTLNVTTPAMASNIITVSAANQAFDGRASFSRYIVSSSVPWEKPDICAPGENLYLFDSVLYGTSFAAPMVTAIVAQLIQARPALATTQDTVKAILTAAVRDSKLRYTPGSAGYTECGAGLVDALSAVNVARFHSYTLNKYIPANSDLELIKVGTFTVTSSTTLSRVSLTWLRSCRISGATHESDTMTDEGFMNLDLCIKDPNGKTIGLTASINANVEIIEFVPEITGEYTIYVQCISTNKNKVYYGVAWW